MSNISICNLCGANYEYINGRWKCPACGAYKTEELSNEEVTLLYNASQKLRVQEFFDAEELYLDIIQKYPKQHEAYWGCVCARYGIKVEEDFNGRIIPTCCFPSIESFKEDKFFKKALEYATPEMNIWYKEQVDYIERIRTEWLEKAKNEKPYDVFISYKDSDIVNGIERTGDSHNAFELYHHLSNQGYNVFYSRESLRDKIGEKYEPYIFHALKTAKVMIIYSSSSEYINSTWVKNEWHRYLKQIEDEEKSENSLLVVCDGFSPNELPKILSSKQCLDGTSKRLYIDIDSYLKRLFSKNETKEKPVKQHIFDELHEHQYKIQVVDPTCVAKGYTIHKCDCGYEYRDSYTPLVDHKFKIIDEVQATCNKPGFIKKVCEICGEKETEHIAPLGHSFSKWVENKHPQCTEDGERQRVCTRCGEVEKQILPKTGHNFTGETHNFDGSTTMFCSQCGCSKTSNQLSNLNAEISTSNHSSSNWNMFWLCLFLGTYGAHKFKENKVRQGLLYLFTGGLLGIGWIIDCVKYYNEAQKSDCNNLIASESVISLREILYNICRYWKSFFTNETNIKQKCILFSGMSLVASLFLLLVLSSQGESANLVSSIIAVVFVISLTTFIIFVAVALILKSCELIQKSESQPMLQNKYAIPLYKAISYVVLIMSSIGLGVACSDDEGAVTGVWLFFLFITWFLVLTIRSHCPAYCQAIKLAKNSTPISMMCIYAFGAVLSIIEFIIFEFIIFVFVSGSYTVT